jgi:hypothetical protein
MFVAVADVDSFLKSSLSLDHVSATGTVLHPTAFVLLGILKILNLNEFLADTRKSFLVIGDFGFSQLPLWSHFSTYVPPNLSVQDNATILLRRRHLINGRFRSNATIMSSLLAREQRRFPYRRTRHTLVHVYA